MEGNVEFAMGAEAGFWIDYDKAVYIGGLKIRGVMTASVIHLRSKFVSFSSLRAKLNLSAIAINTSFL